MNGAYYNRLALSNDVDVQLNVLESDPPPPETREEGQEEVNVAETTPGVKVYEYVRPSLTVIKHYGTDAYEARVQEATNAYVDHLLNGMAACDSMSAVEPYTAVSSRFRTAQISKDSIIGAVREIYQSEVHGIVANISEQIAKNKYMELYSQRQMKPATISILSDPLLAILETLDPDLIKDLLSSVIPNLVQAYLNDPSSIDRHTPENILDLIGVKSVSGDVPSYCETLYDFVAALHELMSKDEVFDLYRMDNGGLSLVYTSLAVIKNTESQQSDHVVQIAFVHSGMFVPELNESDRTQIDNAADAIPRYIANLQFLFVYDEVPAVASNEADQSKAA